MLGTAMLILLRVFLQFVQLTQVNTCNFEPMTSVGAVTAPPAEAAATAAPGVQLPKSSSNT